MATVGTGVDVRIVGAGSDPIYDWVATGRRNIWERDALTPANDAVPFSGVTISQGIIIGSPSPTGRGNNARLRRTSGTGYVAGNLRIFAGGTGSTLAPISPGQPISAATNVYTTASVGTAQLILFFYAPDGSTVISTVEGAAATGATTWLPAEVSGVAPAGAGFVMVQIRGGTAANTDGDVYWDRVRIDYAATAWPIFTGTMSTGDPDVRWTFLGADRASETIEEARSIVVPGKGEMHWNVSAFSVSEESTAIDPSDNSGAYGSISVTIPDSPEVKRYGGKTLILTDGAQGTTTGVIRGRSGTGTSATLSADSRLALLAVERTAQPFQGTLTAAITYYLSLCGVTTGYVIDESYSTRNVAVPGWDSNVYDQLKKLAVAHGFEISLVSNNIVFRPPRGRVAVNYRDASLAWAFDEQQLAQRVEGKFYNSTWFTNQLVYPPNGWNEDVTVYTVDAGATVEADLEIEASLTSIQQPTCVLSVDRDYAASSVYSVSGSDGLIIPPAQWADGGGSVTVEIAEDTRSLKLVIVGMRSDRYAPYSIAMSSGTSDNYSSLRLVGTGVALKEETLSLAACQDPDLAPDEVGVTVENEFFADREQLFQSLLWSAARYASSHQTINVTTKGINRSGDSGSYVYPTIDDVDALYPGATIDSIYPFLGPTVDDWNETLFELVQSDFENQAYGNIAGARTLYDGSWYRIRSASIGANQIQYASEQDNTIDDVAIDGETVDQWNARWDGKTIDDYNIAPVP